MPSGPGQSGEVNEHQTKQLALIYSASLTMLAMVNDFIELGTRGRRTGDRRPVDFSVEDVVESVRRTVQPMAEERELVLRIELGGRRRASVAVTPSPFPGYS
jgi:signal transduction histidine kinase